MLVTLLLDLNSDGLFEGDILHQFSKRLDISAAPPKKTLKRRYVPLRVGHN